MSSTPYAVSVGLNVAPDIIPVTIPIFAMTAVTTVTNELVDYIPGFNFEVVGLNFVCVTPITTGSKAVTITPTIDSVAVPGCSLTISGTKAKGVVTTGVAPTSKLYGNPTSKLNLVSSAMTAFAEGAGYLVLNLRNIGNNS